VSQNQPRTYMDGLDAWVQLAASILVGFGIGWWLDRHFRTETPWWTMGFVLLGSIAGMRSIFRMARRMEAEDTKHPFFGPDDEEPHGDGTDHKR
jgi:F0F1-type ATP synthase assembly protein I